MVDSFWIKDVKKGDGVAYIEVGGRIGTSPAQTLLSHCQALLAAGSRHLVIDMSKVEFIASSGAGTMVVLSESSRAKGGMVQILHASDAVKRVISLLNICHFVALVEGDKEVAANLEANTRDTSECP